LIEQPDVSSLLAMDSQDAVVLSFIFISLPISSCNQCSVLVFAFFSFLFLAPLHLFELGRLIVVTSSGSLSSSCSSSSSSSTGMGEFAEEGANH
jgi:hypothetical protein